MAYANANPDYIPVDPHPATDTTVLRGVTNRPIIPSWVLDKDQRQQTVHWARKRATHTTAYHAARTPQYAAKALGRTPIGVGRGVVLWWRWVFDLDGKTVRTAAAATHDTTAWLALSRERNQRVKLRLQATAWAALGVLIAALFLIFAAPLWAKILAVVTVVGALARLGTLPDKPIVSPAVVADAAPRVTSDTILRALSSLGITALSNGKNVVNFPAPITRDGPGWRADIDLPHGVTWADVAERRDKLASGLRRPIGAVWPEADPYIHAGRLILWVGDKPLADATPPTWPLMKHTRTNIFDGLPFGFDARMRPVTIPLIESNLLIGSLPGAGKTMALRGVLLGAALDPITQLWLYELKGSGDLSMFQPIAHAYGSGPDDNTLHATLTALRELKEELTTRAKRIASLPRKICPENKITPELAAKQSLGLHPIVCAIDECQELFTHPDIGAEAGELATTIIKRGRALGVILLLATQRPDAKSLPTGISSNVGTRYCLRVMDQTANDMILGTSMYKNGYRATQLTPRDKGIGYLAGVHDAGPVITRTYYLNQNQAHTIVGTAHTTRQTAGTLTGQAAGETPTQTQHNPQQLLHDLRAIWPTGQDRAWTETLTNLLANYNPTTYSTWQTTDLTRQLKHHNITTQQIHRTINGTRQNKRGILKNSLDIVLNMY